MIMSMKNSNDTIGNQTRDIPACSAAAPHGTRTVKCNLRAFQAFMVFRGFFLRKPKLHVAMDTSVSPLHPPTQQILQNFPPKSAITMLSGLRHNGARKNKFNNIL
jgi:hypothetical protein